MSEKKMWNIYHEYDMSDGEGYGSFHECDYAGTVSATDEEIQEYLEKWNKPEKHDHCTLDGDLYYHTVRAEVLEVVDISKFGPPYYVPTEE